MFEGTSEIQRLVIARIILGIRTPSQASAGTGRPATRRLASSRE